MSDKLILSIYFGLHDSCITFSNSHEILLHLEAERIFRKKHMLVSSLQMEELVSIGLKYLGKTINDVETTLLASFCNQFLFNDLKLLGKKFDPIITSHHANHIGTTCPAGFENSLIVCADGGSEDGKTKFYLKKGEDISLLLDLSNSILNGHFYGTMTQIIIDPDYIRAHDHCPGKTMGLAALGSFSQEFFNLIATHQVDLNLIYEDPRNNLNKVFNISNDYSHVWQDKRRCDLAYTAQSMWVGAFLEKIKAYKDLAPNICLAGGCALNVILNNKLARKKWFKNVYVSPVSGDGGQSLGAILYHFPNIRCEYPFLGRGFGEINEANHLVDKVVKDLLENKIIAWYQGRSEVGARALGHRSFLGLPNSAEMRIKLSEKVKGREPYRPVSAIMTQEFLPKFTEEIADSPFMTFAPHVYENIKEDLPAIVHNDGTCRVQTLKQKDNKILYDILQEIGKKTGYPVLMNSSFNIAGEPIVGTPEDAMQTFKKCAAEVLYINGERYEKNMSGHLLNLVVLLWVTEMVAQLSILQPMIEY